MRLLKVSAKSSFLLGLRTRYRRRVTKDRAKYLGVVLHVTRCIVFACCLPGGVPHHSANDQRWNSRFTKPLPARAAKVVCGSKLRGTSRPLVGRLDLDASFLADLGDDLANPFGLRPAVSDFSSQSRLQRNWVEHPPVPLLRRSLQKH